MPAVLQGNAHIYTITGDDVTSYYIAGAHKALALCQQFNCRVALLKARSPSCGANQVYDGTFSRQLITGAGITATLLINHGVKVFDETEIDQALDVFEGVN